jgi:hypothetical protein
MPKRRLDLADYYLQTLAQEIAKKYPEVSDYACNVYADRIAQLDFIMDVCGDMLLEEDLETLEVLRVFYKHVGTAMWFMQAGELTNLGAKLGSRMVQAQWNPQQ